MPSPTSMRRSEKPSNISRAGCDGPGPCHVGAGDVGQGDVEALDVEGDLAVAGEDEAQHAGAVLAGLEDEGEELEHEVAVGGVDAVGPRREHAVDGEHGLHPLEGPAAGARRRGRPPSGSG